MIGVIADDITGANDIGSMFSKANYLTYVYNFNVYEPKNEDHRKSPDIQIFDTDSRFDDPKTAYDKVFQATQAVHKMGARQFINKTCSVFRGNIGAEFDAMLDALGEEFAVVVLAFPKNGRKTVDGIHYVHGKKLEESEFRNDPMHPMTQSNLVDILQSQTKRKVTLISLDTVRQGAAVLERKITELKQAFNYVILDAADQSDLRIIAEATKEVRVLCGSSALAEEMAGVLGEPPPQPISLPPYNGEGVFCAAASLMPQTREQIEHMRGCGAYVLELPTLELFDEERRNRLIPDLTGKLSLHLIEGKDAVLHSSNTPEAVKATKEEGFKRGMKAPDISRLVSRTLADIVAGVIEKTGQNRLVIAGGDTSAAVCEKLGVSEMRVWQEISPGLPSCLSFTEPPLWLVLKSGSFGGADFFASAVAHLKQDLVHDNVNS
ncbi:MAG TPA: four-carbon acid sugar kinase family protein [Bacillales bacterium]|nr:four-carbon acid sugar kinase family protein [Bacillales bacterium]